MTSFKDRTGAAWDIALNVGTLRKVAARSGASLLGAATGDAGDGRAEAWFQSLPRLASDVEAFSATLWALVEDAAAARNVGRDEFEARMDGDAIRAASDALTEEIMGFSHPALRDAMAKAKDATPAAPEPASAPPSASAPESSAPIRRPSRCASSPRWPRPASAPSGTAPPCCAPRSST